MTNVLSVMLVAENRMVTVTDSVSKEGKQDCHTGNRIQMLQKMMQ